MKINFNFTIIHISEFDHLDNAEIIGDKGKISLGEPHWCPTKITTPEAIMEFELPEPDMPSKCPNCTGFRCVCWPSFLFRW